MAMDWNRAQVVLEPAGPDRTAEVLEVLDDAAGWLGSRGIAQWPARFEAARIAGALSRGETWLAVVGPGDEPAGRGRVAGTVTLDWADPLWADAAGAAGYVHRLAVRRWAAGLGGHVLDWAADAARARGAGFLRLDCVATNARLRAYYESRGFAHRGDVQVAGAPGGPAAERPVIRHSRYELALAGAATR
ncbi:GNAT family N-acetyltransferase [Kitasatospora sp. NPDC057541]|uniref:GNAT family N-acetyltransferase n=1 Tax=unclassified Kitasatospora TaxID=2633591 RepID=UPI0036BF9399